MHSPSGRGPFPWGVLEETDLAFLFQETCMLSRSSGQVWVPRVSLYTYFASPSTISPLSATGAFLQGCASNPPWFRGGPSTWLPWRCPWSWSSSSFWLLQCYYFHLKGVSDGAKSSLPRDTKSFPWGTSQPRDAAWKCHPGLLLRSSLLVLKTIPLLSSSVCNWLKPFPKTSLRPQPLCFRPSQDPWGLDSHWDSHCVTSHTFFKWYDRKSMRRKDTDLTTPWGKEYKKMTQFETEDPKYGFWLPLRYPAGDTQKGN